MAASIRNVTDVRGAAETRGAADTRNATDGARMGGPDRCLPEPHAIAGEGGRDLSAR